MSPKISHERKCLSFIRRASREANYAQLFLSGATRARDDTLLELAMRNASAIGAGDMFIVLFSDAPDLREALTRIKSLSGVSRIYCATANPTEVVVAATEQGRGIIGIVDGLVPSGVETAEDIAWRRDNLLHTVGYRR